MRKVVSALAVVLLVLGVVTLVAPGEASAQYRQFTGRIDKINDKKLIVDNRKGDKVTFMRVDDTVIEDTDGPVDKKAWGDLKKNDWVTVDWKFIDKPRKAYKIVVIPSREED